MIFGPESSQSGSGFQIGVKVLRQQLTDSIDWGIGDSGQHHPRVGFWITIAQPCCFYKAIDRSWGLSEERSPQSGAHQALNQILAAILYSRGVDSYTVRIGPGYSDTNGSMVNSVTPSTVACATKILSKGSL